MSKIAIIGGSGVYNFDNVKLIDELEVETPYGTPSANIIKVSIDENEFFFLSRHGRGHKISPSEINYRANIFALKSLGVEVIVSISAVGSLKDEMAPGDFVFPNQFIDWTKGLRERSFFGNGIVGHVSTAYPINKTLQNRLYDLSKKCGIKSHKNGSYICIEGPQFSSRAESEMYRNFGASIIGMTNVPESYLAKEAGMAYATIAMVTDYDCWKEEHCTLEEIMSVMNGNYKKAQSLLLEIVPSLVKDPISFVKENQNSIVSDKSDLTDIQKSIIKVLLT